MSNEYGLTCPCHGIKDPTSTIRRSRHQLIPRGIKVDIQYLIGVTSQGMDTLTRSHIPDLACAINRARDTQVGGIIELSTTNLTMMTGQGMDTPPCLDIPDFDGMIERTRDDPLTMGVEV